MQRVMPRQRAIFYYALFTSLLLTLFLGCSRQRDENWQLTQVRHHLPKLEFALTDDQGQKVSAQTYQGLITLVYFGYTHCPDVCPETMARLMLALSKLGDDARAVRILFISIDPARDTPASMHRYVNAFDAEHVTGLTGTLSQVEALAKRYRVAYQSEKPDADNRYEVLHSSAIYIFDQKGQAQLMATAADSADNIAHDLRILIQSS
ncbi:SCO family protein [Mycoavidus sp. B2-EB]|uniref:SCO family protein n=1 Tax=Mycoavidus sp. B2-EB TaxID=2651972 RepID=UPI00162520BC|nr:SCO family protein [Mycoavidus sp. B2-EB]BBO59324.1 photosynthetic protein synthase I [Mycoavidus sp. B2-EB]